MIRRLSRNQIGQVVRDDGPQTHLKKAGTPTMGGGLILVSIAISVLLWGDLSNLYVWVLLLGTLGFGVIGWADDYLKLSRKSHHGLPARWKYCWQSVLALLIALVLYFASHSAVSSELLIPFFKHVGIQLGPFYILLTYFVVVGSSNAVNLTDGLDGLAVLPTVMVAGGLGIFAYLTGNVEFAHYLSITYVPGAGEVAVFCSTLVGGRFGIFMV